MRLLVLSLLLLSHTCFGVDIETLTQQAEGSDPQAQFQLGKLYQQGGDELSQSFSDAAYWYQQAAQSGSSEAQLALADLYLNGLGVDKSTEAALFWLTNAANSNNSKAQYLLGQFYEQLSAAPDHIKLAELWYEKASSQNEEAELAYSRLLEQSFNNQRAKQVAAIDQLEVAFDSAPIELSAQAKSINESKKQQLDAVYGLIAIIVAQLLALLWLIRRNHKLKLVTESDQNDSHRQSIKLERELNRKQATIKQQKRQLETMFKHIKQLQSRTKDKPAPSNSEKRTQKAPRSAANESPISMACALFGFEPDALPDEKQIKTRYKQLSKIYHPDRKGSDEEMKRLNQSLKVILSMVKK